MKASNANPGDYVEVHLTRKIYEGTLLESPQDEKGIVLLKLNNGYNIGLIKKDVLEIKVKKKGKEIEEDLVISRDKSKPNIGMIITGGTIASKFDPKTGGVKWLTNPNNLFKYYPEIFEKVNITKIEVPFMKGSEDMDYKDWQKIVKVAENMLNDGILEGIIITHGTDTLHYTSAALSFMLRNLNKPVVLTYSQRSIDRASSDANLNLQCASLVAISDIAEVVLVGHASSNDDYCNVMRGTKVKKMHSSKRDAFKVINDKLIAKVYSDRIDFLGEYKVRSKSKVKSDIKFEEKVALLKFYPGQDSSILDYYVKNKYKGLVVEMTGLGHVATKSSKNSWVRKLKEVQEKGLIVCAAAQTIYGRLDPLVYSNGREIMKTGVIYLGDMLSETALVKLGWVLGHSEWANSKEKVKEKMLENISGELNDRIQE
jgi:glutamyl-tRNA(Gln) amidotransferase subunit D